MSFKWLPNTLTIARCGMAFLVGWAILALSPMWALILFVITALSDFLDGYAARKLDAVSAFGAFLDPIADKLLVAVALIALCLLHGLDPVILIPTSIIIARDLTVTLLRLKPDIKLPVVKLAKWKTATEMVGIGGLLLAPMWNGVTYPTDAVSVALISLVLIWIAALLSAYTGFRYAQSAFAQMQNGRA